MFYILLRMKRILKNLKLLIFQLNEKKKNLYIILLLLKFS